MNVILNQQNTKHILISGYYGFGNTGDEAILNSMVRQIRDKISNCIITVVSENPEETKSLHEVNAIYRLDYAIISKEIERSDLVILGGGGLFQDHHSIKISATYQMPGFGVTRYAEIPVLAKMHGKPVMFYSQGFGPLFSKESKTFVSYICSLADIITTRDDASKRLLEEIGVNSKKIISSIDPAFEIPFVNKEEIKAILVQEGITSDEKLICISVRQWIDKSQENNYANSIAQSLNDFLRKNDVHLLFLPFQIYDKYNDDSLISKQIIEKIEQKEKCHLLSKVYHPRDMAGIIGNAELLIGMRLHSIIFAARYNTPAVALSYDPKVSNQMKDLMLEDFCFNVIEDESAKLIEIINSAWKNRVIIRKRMKESIEKIYARNNSAAIAYSLLGGPITQVLDAHLNHEITEKFKDQKFKDTIYRQAELLSFIQMQYQQLSNEKKMLIEQSEVQQRNHEKYANDLSNQIDSYKNQINSYKNQMDSYKNQIDSQIESHKIQIDSYKNQIDSQIDSHKIQIDSYEDQINSYKNKNRVLESEIQRIHSLRTWRIISFIGDFLYKSKIAAIASSIIKKIKNVRLKLDVYRYKNYLNKILSENDRIGLTKGIVIYPATIDWGHLFQRPQQLAISFANHGYIFFYCTGNYNVDNVHGFKKIRDYLYLCNVPMEVFRLLKKPIYLISYTPNKVYIPIFNSPFIIYDHIDELEVFYNFNKKMEDDHQELLREADIVIATAKRLLEKDKNVREDVILCQNGVDYNIFQISKKKEELKYPNDLKPLLDMKRPIIGYYGAMAPWLDYELIKFAAENRGNYNFVLIGPDYDGLLKSRLKEYNIDSCVNVFWLGAKNYEEIPIYLAFFDVAIIPFKINNITLSTSPIKLFEYMAGGKPVVTTDLPECREISGLLISKTKEEFVEYLDKAIILKNDTDYLQLLDKHARENTWDAKVELIINRINQLKNEKSR